MIAITGATGNTGSKIAHLLLDKGEEVRVISRSLERLRKFEDRGAEISGSCILRVRRCVPDYST